jgi:hypothetical protein
LRTTEGSEAISALECGGLLRAIALAMTGKVSVRLEQRPALESLATTAEVVLIYALNTSFAPCATPILSAMIRIVV